VGDLGVGRGRGNFHGSWRVRGVLRGNRSGVTLLEMILAVALSAFLLVIAYSTYFGINRSIDLASEEQELLETGRILVELLRHDLRGVVGSQKYPLKSDVVDIGNETASNIEFVTSSSVNKNPMGLSKVGYELRKTKEGDKIFVRMETRELKGDLKKVGTGFEVSRIITNFDLSFYDGTSWTDTWGESTEGKLPRQVKITVNMKDGKGKTKTFVAEEAILGGS
jgi:type II secretion system protein J